LTEFRAHPPSAAPSDGARFGIVNNTPEEWARFGTAVAAEESGFRPGESRVTSRESSYGIFQYDHNQAYGNAYDVDNSVRAFVRDSNDAANSGKLDGSTLARRFSTIGGQYWWRTVRSLPRAQKIADRAGAIPTRPTVTRPQAWTGTELQKVVRPGAPGTPSGPAPVRPAPIETTPEALRPGMPGTPGGPAPERPERPIAPERPERPTTPQVPGVSITGFSQAFPGQGLPGPEQNNQATSVMGMARGRLHAGGDYYAPIGTPLQAQGDGKVVNISDHNTHGTGNYGHTVVIQYDNGYTVQYSHLNPDSAKFKVGDKVTRGEVFAESGASGTMAGLGKSGPGVTPPHVHTEVVKNEHYKGGLVGGVGSPSRRYVLQPEEVFQFGKGGKNIPQTTVPVAPSASSQPSDQSITPSASSQPSNAPINQVEPDSTTGEAKGDEVTGDLPSGGAAAFLTKQFKELSGQREAGDRSLVGFSQEARNRAKASMTDVAKTYPEPKKEGATFEGPIDRSDVAKEIEDNPALKKRLAWMMRGEVDHYDRATWEQKQTQLESALNRYQLRKKEYAEHPEARPKGGSGPYTLEETLQTVRDPPGEGKPERYYAKDTYKAEVEPTNEQVDDFVKQHLEPALKGSNVGTKRLKFTPTGNSSIGVAEHHKLHGDPYGTVDGPELYELDANDNPNFSKYAPGPEKGLKHLRTRRPLSDFSNPPEMEKRDVPLPRSRPKEAPQEIRVNIQHSDADVAVHKNPRHHHDGDAPSGGSDKDTAKGGGESKNLNIGDNGESHSPELDS
jgi:murein DD-endopeptidase MepM/ murein hydrolase activator NlpD